jgi:hypothetical protein
MTSGLTYAINTVAAACIPKLFENMSITRPRKKPRINNAYLGVFRGNKIINRI